MNLEPIDTSTTAGKARVMQLAAEGRRVVWRFKKGRKWIQGDAGNWDWPQCDFAIVVEPVGPEELWFVYKGTTPAMGPFGDEQLALDRAEDAGAGYTPVHYIRADLAGRDE